MKTFNEFIEKKIKVYAIEVKQPDGTYKIGGISHYDFSEENEKSTDKSVRIVCKEFPMNVDKEIFSEKNVDNWQEIWDSVNSKTILIRKIEPKQYD